jgi:hypothetical protein
MDSCIFTLMQSAGIPEAIHNNVIEFAKPDKLDGDLKKELELMGTFMIFKKLALECDREWESYYKAWNKRRLPGYIYPDEDDPNPAHIWSYIEGDLVKGDKDSAQHFLENLAIIRDSDYLLEKVSNYERVVWEYQGRPSRKYVRTVVKYTAIETKKDLISYIDCLQTIIEKAKQVEAYNARRAMYDSEEEFQWALQQEEEDYMASLPYDPYDDYY